MATSSSRPQLRPSNDRAMNNAFAGEAGRKTGLRLARRPVDEETGLESIKGIFTPTPRRPVAKPKTPANHRYGGDDELQHVSPASDGSAAMEIEESALTPADYRLGHRAHSRPGSARRSLLARAGNNSVEARRSTSKSQRFSDPSALNPASVRKTPVNSAGITNGENVQRSVEVSPSKLQPRADPRSVRASITRRNIYDLPYSEERDLETPSRLQPAAVQAREARKSLGRRDKYPLQLAENDDDEDDDLAVADADGQPTHKTPEIDRRSSHTHVVGPPEEHALPTPEDTYHSSDASASQHVNVVRHSIPGPIDFDDSMQGPDHERPEADVSHASHSGHLDNDDDGDGDDDVPMPADDEMPADEELPASDHVYAEDPSTVLHSDHNLDPQLKNLPAPDTIDDSSDQRRDSPQLPYEEQETQEDHLYVVPEGTEPMPEEIEESALEAEEPVPNPKKGGRKSKAAKTKRSALASKDPNKAPRPRTGSPKARNARSNTRQRTETPGPDMPNRTRSGRTLYKPLEYWKGERAVRHTERDVLSNAIVSRVTEIVRYDDVTPAKRSRAPSEPARGKRRKGSRGGKSRAGSYDSDGSEGEYYRREQRHVDGDGDGDVESLRESLEEWEIDQGVQRGPVRVWDSGLQMGRPEDEVEEALAFSRTNIVPQAVPNAQFRYAKQVTKPWFGSGIVELPVGGYKRSKNSRKMHMAFFVHKGKVEVEVNSNRWILSPGGIWQVPRGNFYSIHNAGKSVASLFFAQGCESEVAAFVDSIDYGGPMLNAQENAEAVPTAAAAAAENGA